jgi:hypothetical protein
MLTARRLFEMKLMDAPPRHAKYILQNCRHEPAECIGLAKREASIQPCAVTHKYVG